MSKDNPTQRLDVALVTRGHFESRMLARAAIAAGQVFVDGNPATKAAREVGPEAVLSATAPWSWVSRAGLKLEAALKAFAVSPAGLDCLDLGASTGGFSDVLLHHGAAHVTAVDVGTGQFHARLRDDPRVSLHEQTDARTLTPAHFPKGPASLIVADLSFIGLAKALPVPLALAAPAATLITLVKPQFEAGPERVGKGGIVAPGIAETIADEVCTSLDGLAGFRFGQRIDSPVAGGDGNREFLALFRRGG